MNINFGAPQGTRPPQDNIPKYRDAGKKVGRTAVIVVVLVLVAALASASFTVINEGYIGVKYQFGKIVDDSLSAGLNFKIPFVQTIRQVDVREQMYQMDANAYTKDTQTVEGIQTKLNYVLRPGRAFQYHPEHRHQQCGIQAPYSPDAVHCQERNWAVQGGGSGAEPHCGSGEH